ncbi:hypothetical protein KM043_000817 [Ampulex compressa]|nr:hypothetical protein KM043_000817 [Ampulex compressa]
MAQPPSARLKQRSGGAGSSPSSHDRPSNGSGRWLDAVEAGASGAPPSNSTSVAVGAGEMGSISRFPANTIQSGCGSRRRRRRRERGRRTRPAKHNGADRRSSSERVCPSVMVNVAVIVSLPALKLPRAAVPPVRPSPNTLTDRLARGLRYELVPPEKPTVSARFSVPVWRSPVSQEQPGHARFMAARSPSAGGAVARRGARFLQRDAERIAIARAAG